MALHQRFFNLRAALSRSFAKICAPRSISILLYHGVPLRARHPGGLDAGCFEEQVRFLAHNFTLVGAGWQAMKPAALQRPRVLLTFDDGFRNNAEVAAPILRKYRVPAMFFVASRHTKAGKYLWFSYLSALLFHFRGSGFLFRGRLVDMSGNREAAIQRLANELLGLRPHPAAMYQAIEEELPALEDFVPRQELRANFEGMSPQQIRDLAADPLFTIGAHTVDHPYLTSCEPKVAQFEIRENKRQLEEVTGKACATVAYPHNDYSPAILEYCRRIGFASGYSVHQQLHLDPELEIARVGVFSPSLTILTLKALWGTRMQRHREAVMPTADGRSLDEGEPSPLAVEGASLEPDFPRPPLRSFP